jgi:hypothetical protein
VMRFAFADPPCPGEAGYYAEHLEVDHVQLIERLLAGLRDEWALATRQWWMASPRWRLRMRVASRLVCPGARSAWRDQAAA